MYQHVLVVGGARDLPARLRRIAPGTRTSVICRSSFLPRMQQADEHVRVIALGPDASEAEWVRWARAVHARDPFTAVAAYGERDQDHCAAIGRALTLPAHTPATVTLVYHKEAMRRRLREAGVDPTASARVVDLAEARRFVAAHGLPCIVKPVTGAGSSGVALVSHDSELEPALVRAAGGVEGLPDAGVLMEQYHRGRELSVEAFSHRGDHQVVAVTAKYTDPVTFVELGHVVPAPIGREDAEALHALVPRVLDALGVTFGPTHTEVVLTAQGPRVIETHIRLAGDDIPLLVHSATGVDLVDCTVRQTLGEDVLPGLRRRLAGTPTGTSAAVWFASTRERGVLRSVAGVPDAEAVPGVEAVRILAAPGALCGGLDSSYARIASVRASAPTPQQAVATARAAAASLDLRVDPEPATPAGGTPALATTAG
ncbi:ATP-grasp domain-containing protein [Streptomyces sp.]|uniref:ATP-grasp domain-containing protein n=1 Tax=Streptomyces sp. TaxID=1931 RepID=UPI002F402C1B